MDRMERMEPTECALDAGEEPVDARLDADLDVDLDVCDAPDAAAGAAAGERDGAAAPWQWMTAYEARSLARAVERALREGLSIAGRGTTKDGRPVYAVPSRSEPGVWRLVVVGPARLACDCPWGTWGGVCAHRGRVYLELAWERAARTGGALPPLVQQVLDRIEAEQAAQADQAAAVSAA